MGKIKSYWDNLIDSILRAFGAVEREETHLGEAYYEQQKQLAQELDRMDYEYREANGYVQPNYDDLLPDSLGMTQKSYEQRTDEELEKAGKASLAASDQKTRADMQSDLENALNKADATETKAQTTYDQKMEAARLAEEEGLERSKNAMIRQGLVNSSISSGSADAIRSEAATYASGVQSTYNAALEDVRIKRQIAESEYQTALQQYELKYAEQLSKTIAKLQEEEAKKLEEVNAYNKKIAEQEAKYQQDRLKQIAELERQFQTNLEERLAREAADEAENGYTPEKDAEMYARYQKAREYYDQMDAAAVRKLIDENAEYLASRLGKYYTPLVRAYANK